MKKIDLKDRKILFELDHNARISISEISKKIKLTKGGVVYRLKNLEESGVIKNYYTVIDTFKIGYICLRFLIKLQYATIKTKETRGSGLGLTIANHIIEAHGGTMEVESEVGKGSTFTIRIPLT